MSENVHPELPGNETRSPPSPPPPRGPRLRSLASWILVVAVVFWIGASWGGAIKSGVSEMWRTLVGAGPEEAPEDLGFYSCGMHPWIVLPGPGTCPICRMDLTPIDPAKFTGEISIDPRVVQSIGVRIEKVTTGPLVRTIRTVGTVDYDETTVQDVNIKVSGWIEKLYVDYVGAEVREGEPLFDLFSRELYDTQQQYLLAYRNRSRAEVPFLPESARDSRQLLDSSRIRLEYYDITAQQIADLEKRGSPSKTMTIFNPHTGVVISKHANTGMLVDPGMLVYRIADLSKVWVLVTLYEYQLPYVADGQKAIMSLPYIPGQTFEGRVIYIYPYLNKATREQQVRMEFDNPDLFLKPGMFANIELRNTLARERVLAPRAAVIDTGERQVAFVSLGEGRFEPREVRMGIETEGGRVEILDGLKPGEMVVTSSQFLLDSEAKIREALGKMIRGDLASEQQAIAAVSGKSELKVLPPKVEEQFTKVLDAYFSIGKGLAGDSIAGIATPASAVAKQLDAVVKVPIPEDPHFWHRHTEAATAIGKALELAGEGDLSEAREKFADLSKALDKLFKASGIPSSYGKEVQELHCPMYREGQGGGMWLQPAGVVENPFFGSTMLRCFDSRVALPVTGGVEASPEEPLQSRPEAEAGEPPAGEEPAGDTPEPPDEPRDRQERSEADRQDRQPGEESEEPKAPEVDGKQTASPGDTQEALDNLVKNYLALSALLADDSADGAARHLAEIRRNAAEFTKNTGDQKVRTLAEKVHELLSGSETPQDLESLRKVFAPLSDALLELLAVRPPCVSVAAKLFAAHCPMARANWIQDTQEIRNPYYGRSMPRCGKVTMTIEPGTGQSGGAASEGRSDDR